MTDLRRLDEALEISVHKLQQGPHDVNGGGNFKNEHLGSVTQNAT